MEAVDNDIYTLLGGTKKDREKVKVDFYNIFFGKFGQWDWDIFNRFQDNFPLLAEKIIQMKKKNYKQLAHFLQRVESDIVVNGAYLEFLETYEGEFALTIHDSIVSTKENLDKLEKLMFKHAAIHGVEIQIGRKKMTNSCLNLPD